MSLTIKKKQGGIFMKFSRETIEAKLAEQHEFLRQEHQHIQNKFDMYDEEMTEDDRYYLNERVSFINLLNSKLKEIIYAQKISHLKKVA